MTSHIRDDLNETNIHVLPDIPFETENELRHRGTSRTPDILLSYPLSMEVPNKTGDGTEWKVVYWIDSKVSLVR